MKKNLKYMAGSGALMLLTAVASVSCTEDNDWDVDASYDRLFSVTSSSISVTESTTSADVKWTKTPNTEYYIIQVSKDSLYNDVDTEAINVITYGEDGSITSSPYTLENLEGSTKYFLRIKAKSSQKAESKWSYLEKASFKTKAEQILNEAQKITGNSAVISWPAGTAVTHLVWTWNYEDVAYRDSIFLDDTAIAEGQYKLTGLLSKKTYNVSIWNGENQRGSVKFTTTEAYPDNFDVVSVADADALKAVLDNPTEYIQDNDGNLCLVIPAGTTLNYNSEESNLTIPAEIKSIVFWGATGGETPVFKPKGLGFAGDHSYVRFYNLDIQNNGTSGDYIINQNVTGTIGEIQIENCSISNTRGIVRVQGDGAKGTINAITINNCQIANIGSYGLVNTKISGLTLGTITVSNSTINKVDAGNVFSTQQAGITFNIENCTFYNCVNAATKPFIDVNKMSNVTVNISKTIIGKFIAYADETTVIKATSLKNGESDFTINDSDVYTTSDCPYNPSYTWGESLEETSAQLFADPDNGDFHLQKSLNAGDPRWLENE